MGQKRKSPKFGFICVSPRPQYHWYFILVIFAWQEVGNAAESEQQEATKESTPAETNDFDADLDFDLTKKKKKKKKVGKNTDI